MENSPRIVLFDLETIPILKEVMKIYPGIGAYPGLTFKASITSIICFGFKVFGEKKVSCVNAWDFEKRWKKNVNDDYEVVKKAYDILKDADAVVTHNGKRFDWKFLQTRLLFHRLPLLPKINHIDTCAVSRGNLMAYNNKLNTLGKFLIGEEKLENGGWDLWVKVLERDKKSTKLMSDYCKQDVLLLEKVFKRLIPLVKNMPNQNLYLVGGSKRVCPSCGSTRLISSGIRATTTRTYRRYSCKDCGSWSRTDMKDELPRHA